MSRPLKKYTKEEKLEIVKQSLDEDESVTGLAKRYGLSPNTIYNWRSRYYNEMGIEPEGQGVKQMTEEERRISKLKKQLREVELERDILKKAIGIFSKGDGKSTNP